MKDYQDFIIYGVGDNMPFKKDTDASYTEVKPLFTQKDALVFGQLESVVGTTKYVLPQCSMPLSSDPTLPACMKRNGFDVVSMAGNHTLDYGYIALEEGIENVKKAGLVCIGVGMTEDEARKIHYVEKNGTTVAFLGYCSILPQDYWAEDDRPGCNPARGITAYVAREHDQPQTPCEMYSFPHKQDLKRMIADITEAKKNADIVVVSFHWGIHFIRGTIADYQQYYAHFAIDAGADLILGHHAHVIKPIEVYKGKAIFYSLGNFCCDEGLNEADILMKHKTIEGFLGSKKRNTVRRLETLTPIPGRRKSDDYYCHTICKAYVHDGKIVKVSFIPSYIDEANAVRLPDPDNEYFKQELSILKETSQAIELDTNYDHIEGTEVVLVP